MLYVRNGNSDAKLFMEHSPLAESADTISLEPGIWFQRGDEFGSVRGGCGLKQEVGTLVDFVLVINSFVRTMGPISLW